MERSWNIRLKKAREAAGLSLKDVSAMEVFDISQQSLIKYEKGEVFPRIDLLEKMCKKYNVTIDYIMYGSSELPRINETSGHLVSLFFLLYGRKLKYNESRSSLEITDKRLATHIMAMDAFIKRKEISTIDDLSALIHAIKKMSEEQN